MMQLKDMQTGDCGKIAALSGASGYYRNRLIAMGLLPGTAFRLVRMAPLGDPVEMEVRGFRLILRKQEAALLLIEPMVSG